MISKWYHLNSLNLQYILLYFHNYFLWTFLPEIHIDLLTFIDIIEKNGVEILVVNLFGREGEVESSICSGDLKGGGQIRR